MCPNSMASFQPLGWWDFEHVQSSAACEVVPESVTNTIYWIIKLRTRDPSKIQGNNSIV